MSSSLLIYLFCNETQKIEMLDLEKLTGERKAHMTPFSDSTMLLCYLDRGIRGQW